MLKNPGALITQPRVKNAPRRFILDSRLLEVLLQIAVLRPGGVLRSHTEPLRLEEVLLFLRERYGLYIDRLPPGDGFGLPSIQDWGALHEECRCVHCPLAGDQDLPRPVGRIHHADGNPTLCH